MLVLNKNKYFFSIIFITLFCSIGFAQQNKGIVKIETDSKIDKIIASKKQYNKNLKTIKGYKIQLFYGNEKNSYKIKDEFKAISPEIDTKIIFSSPQWKVQIGNFRTRLEADRQLVEIKKEYPSAIVIASEIDK